MCTVSWMHQPGGYRLFCNRDEKLVRGPALGPRVIRRGGVRYVAPVDSDFGGTWIAVNEFGLSLCLLNGNVAGREQRVRRSRGLVLRELAWTPSTSECLLSLRQLDLAPFAAFTLVVLEPGRPAAVADWNGDALVVDPCGDLRMPLISSSYDSAGVARSRRNAFARLVQEAGAIDENVLRRFHASHGTGADAYSACMHRHDAGTVSFSQVLVTAEEIRFHYSPGAPCRAIQTERQTLSRAA